MAGLKYSNIEYDPLSGGFFTKKNKRRPPARAAMFNEGSRSNRKRNYGSNTRSRFDADILLSETSSQSRSRFVPFIKRHERPGYMKGKRYFDSHPARASNKGGVKKKFVKVTVYNSKKYDEVWLLNTIQKASSVPFTPLEWQSYGSRVHFFVDDQSAAEALKNASKTLQARDNIKIVVFTLQHPPPFDTREMKDEDIEHFKNCMQKRYYRSKMAMDLNNLRRDPDLVANHVDLILNRWCNMIAMLHIIEENVPELLSLDLSSNKLFKLDDMSSIETKAAKLKSLNLSNNSLRSIRELDKISTLKLEELWLEGNPLCKTFRDKSLYISAVRERFPKLLRLDGEELSPPISFDLEGPTELLPFKGSYFENDETKTLVLQFLQQYYTYYDGEDRQGLLNVYHDEACCSLYLSTAVRQNNVTPSTWGYHKFSRNLRTIKDLARLKLLKHKRLNIVGFLNKLPRTLHALNSFVVDINVQTNSLLCFVVNGVYKEVSRPSRNTVRAFSRMFVAVPDSDAGLLLVNDELFIRNARHNEILSALFTPAPTPSSSPVHHDMVQAFILFSGMNSDWSQKCLQENDWDFDKAAQIFLNLKAEGKIPDVALIKCPTP